MILNLDVSKTSWNLICRTFLLLYETIHVNFHTTNIKK